MKKIVLIMLAAAAMLASCTKDNTSDTNGGKMKLTMRVPSPAVQFSRSMTNQGGIHYVTDHELRFKLQVFDRQSGEIVDEQVEVVDILTPTISFDIYLEPSVYDFLIWADFTQNSNGADMYYNTASLKSVSKINTGESYVGNHAQDAYFGAVLNADLTVSGYTLPGITLKRPFGRMEIYANDFDMASPTNMPAKAIITYNTPLPSEFNVATGDVTSTTLVEGEHFTNTLTLPSSGKELEVIYDYIFAAKDNNTTIGYTVSLLNSSDAAISTRTMRTIPIQQNRRTIADGDFFNIEFAEDDMNVSVDDDFGGTVEIDKLLIPEITEIIDITSSSFKVKWTSASLNAFTLELSPSSTFAADVKRFFSIAGKEFEATGLDALTKYYVRVKTLSANTGFTLTSEQSQATTLSGGTPSVIASSYMDSEKIIVPVVRVEWFDLTSPAATVKLTPTSGTTITHTLTSDEISAGKATIKSENLLCATTYTVDILDAAGASIISESLTTKDVSANITVLEGGTADTPTDLGTTLDDASRRDSIFLKTGVYEVSTSCTVSKNLVLIGQDRAATMLRTSSYALNGTFDRAVFKNLTISDVNVDSPANRDFIGTSVDNLGSFDVKDVIIENCYLRDKRVVFNVTARTANTGNLGKFTFSNSMLYGTADVSSNGSVVNAAVSEKNFTCSEFAFTNSTITNTGRGLIIMGANKTLPQIVSVDHCTLYNVVTQAGTLALIDNRVATADGSSVSISNSIIHFAPRDTGVKNRVAMYASGTNYPPTTITNVAYLSESGVDADCGSSSYGNIILPLLTKLTTNAASTFGSAMLDPSGAGASFKIQSGAGVSNCGDPRWN